MTRSPQRPDLLTGLSPVLGPDPRVLILGSMPGAESLAQRRYYVGRGNRFWRTMATLLGFEQELDYEQRVNVLAGAGIGLWDVLHRCERTGSLDSGINESSEEPNDLAGLLVERPRIAAVFFNGRRAAASYRRHLAGVVELPGGFTLPSTSAANARVTPAELVEEWRVITAYLAPDGIRGRPEVQK